MIKIQSVYFDTLGHTVAEKNLIEGFAKSQSNLEYNSISVSQIKNMMGWKSKLFGLIAFPILVNYKFDIGFNRLRTELAISAMVWWYLAKHTNKEIDVFHFRTQSICLLISKFIRKNKVVITIDMTAKQLIQIRPQNEWFYYPIVWLENKVFNSGATIVSYSEHTSKSIINDYGVSKDKSINIPPSVKSDFFKTKVDRNSKKLQILFVGNDFIRKGGDLLWKVFVNNFKNTADLHIVSNDSMLETLGQKESVFLHRNIQPNTNQLVDLFLTSDIFVLPTREEAYGLVFSEAMAAGLPCIGTRTMAIPELIDEGKTGYLIEIDNEKELIDRLQILIENTSLRADFAANAKKKAMERYTLDVFLNNYYFTLERLIVQ